MVGTTVCEVVRRDERGRIVAEDGYPVAGLATTAEAVALSGLSRSQIYAMLRRGELHGRRFGRVLRISWHSLRAAFLVGAEP